LTEQRARRAEAKAKRLAQQGEVAEVGHVLWEHHQTIYRTFDAYSTIGATSVSHMSGIAFKRFVEDCELSDNKSKFCQKAHIDQVFLMVNAAEVEKRAGGRSKEVDLAAQGGELGSEEVGACVDDDKGSLNRCEWLQCLVRIAVLKYVISKQIPDVSRAVDQLFVDKIIPLLGAQSTFDANDFRQQQCYNEKTDAVLLSHADSIRALFNGYAAADGVDMANRQASVLLSLSEWMQIMKHLELIDQEFTVREASLAFAWSRMRVVDEGDKKRSKAKLENLSCEDFFEALVHVSLMKALPTDEEVASSSAIDGGAWLLELKRNPADYLKWITANPASWETPPRQPVDRCVHMLITLIVRIIKQAVSKSDVSVDANLVLDKKEAVAFIKSKGGGGSKGK